MSTSWVNLKSFFSLISAGLIVIVPIPQSNQPAFDAVSIRKTADTRTVKIGDVSSTIPAKRKPCEYTRDRVICRLPLWNILREAFEAQEFEIEAPAWTKDAMFDLQATMPLDTSTHNAKLMMQTALLEQFGLQYHKTRRSTPVYALIPTENGPNLTVFDSEHPQTRTRDTPRGPVKDTLIAAPGRFFMAGTTLDIFALNLKSIAGLGRPVVNETGLAGKYTIDLNWKSSADPDEVVNIIDNGILRAMEQQLGLKLVKKDEDLDYFVVDHLNKVPAEQ